MKVVAAAEYGALVWRLDTTTEPDGTATFLMRPNRAFLEWRHITVLKEWVHVPTEAILHPQGRIVWKKVDQALPLPLAYCLQGNSMLTAAQIKHLIRKLGIPQTSATTKAAVQQYLLEALLGDKDQQQKAFMLFEKNVGKHDQPLDSDLEDVISCLDEDDANALDLKELKAKKRQKKLLLKRRGAEQDGSKPVPGQRGRGRGRGRGKGRGKGRGRAAKKIFVKMKPRPRAKTGGPPMPPDPPMAPSSNPDPPTAPSSNPDPPMAPSSKPDEEKAEPPATGGSAEPPATGATSPCQAES